MFWSVIFKAIPFLALFKVPSPSNASLWEMKTHTVTYTNSVKEFDL